MDAVILEQLEVRERDVGEMQMKRSSRHIERSTDSELDSRYRIAPSEGDLRGLTVQWQDMEWLRLRGEGKSAAEASILELQCMQISSDVERG